MPFNALCTGDIIQKANCHDKFVKINIQYQLETYRASSKFPKSVNCRKVLCFVFLGTLKMLPNSSRSRGFSVSYRLNFRTASLAPVARMATLAHCSVSHALGNLVELLN